MAIRTRTSDGYQQVELTSELLHSQSGATQQVISTVPCTKHLPFFLSILLVDLSLFGAGLLFALWATQYGDGLGYAQAQEASVSTYRQLNLHALLMLVAMVYLNGQAITCYKSNYLIKHKSLNMLLHFLLHLLTIGGALGGVYMAHQGQETVQQSARSSRVSHFYSLHSWCGLAALILFSLQYLFGFFTFFVTLCCRKLTARLRARALPIHRTLAMSVWCFTTGAVISGLTQLARFQLSGQDGRNHYRDLAQASSLIINLAGCCVLLATLLIFFITFIFKRRQAHDLPVLFKIILLVSQFVQLVLVLVLAEFVFQVVTPHVNKVISGQFLQNTTFNHIISNATHHIGNLIQTATQQITGGSSVANTLPNADNSTNGSSSIILGSSANLTL